MLRGAAPDKSCVVRSTAARVVIVSVAGARVEKSRVQGREWSSRQDQVRCLVEVVSVGKGTVGGPSRRDVGRAKQPEHFHNNSFNSPLPNRLLTPSTFFQPTPTDFFLSINNNLPLPFNLATTNDFFLSIYNQQQPLSSENCSILYRSQSSGKSHGETGVIVRSEHPDWTGPSCGLPFWAVFQPDVSLAQPRRACLGLGRWMVAQLP